MNIVIHNLVVGGLYGIIFLILWMALTLSLHLFSPKWRAWTRRLREEAGMPPNPWDFD